MKVIDRRVVWEDRNPRSPTRYLALPYLSQLADGRLLIACRVGSAKDTADGRLQVFESRDEGKSWRSLGYPWPGQWNGVPCEQRAGILTEPERGHLFCAMAYCERKDPALPMCNERTGGVLPLHLVLSESADHGRNWSPLREVDVAPLTQPSLTNGVTVLPDGSWAVWFETNKRWDDAGKWFPQAAFCRSTDQGRTWQPPSVVAADPTGRFFYWDGRYTVLHNGTLLALYWTYDGDAKQDVEITMTTSADAGRTWAKPRSIGVAGQIAMPLELADGRILMAYVHRHAPPSLRVRLSDDGGRTWNAAEELVVYEKTRDRTGEVTSGATADYFQDMQAWTFGWITARQLPGGDVLACYYAGDTNTSAIHVTRIALRGQDPPASFGANPE